MSKRLVIVGAVFATIWLICTPPCWAQTQPSKDPPASDPEVPAPLIPRPEFKRFWVSGQANFIFQWHPPFRAPYTGENSLRPKAEHATSTLVTLYTGAQVARNTEIFLDLESTGGRGIGDALGLAGSTDLDVVRNPDLGAAPYVARLMVRQIIPLSSERVTATRGPLGLASELPVRRLELRFGKFGMVDFFDVNSLGSDSHLQFMNWTVDNAGTYDYAADTRGYTFGAMLEYQDRRWAVRFAEGLMPKVANGIHLDASISRARAENLEFEWRRGFLPRRDGVVRMLVFRNHANMGRYRDAVDDFLAGRTPVPDITAHPLETTTKYGFGFNFEQQLNGWLGLFGRWGWNEGRHESYAYTEVDQTVLLGAGANGRRWRRKFDRAGIAFVSNGISRDHQQYLALGGHGFLLGDGRLHYGREQILESYYTFYVWRGIYPSVGLQYIVNPGYNRDRGPVLVPTVRLHVEF